MSLTTPPSVQKLQTALHDKAKGSPKFRFYALYDKMYRQDDVVEDNQRVQLEDFRSFLRDHLSSLVLTFNNVRELAAPLAKGDRMGALRQGSPAERRCRVPIRFRNRRSARQS